MSWKVANLCAERKFGSPVRKQIIMFLADKASDDGAGIWCSKGTIQRHTELGETTVKRTINELLREGILIEVGRRACKNGYTVVYRIVLREVAGLEAVFDPEDDPEFLTGSAADRVHSGPSTGAAADPVPGPQWPPNHPKTIQKPPTRASAREADHPEFERAWEAYPSDRRRSKPACRSHFETAIEEGASGAEIVSAVAAYSSETEGYTRSKVCFSDNWFREARWRDHVQRDRDARSEMAKRNEDHLLRVAEWVRERNWMCRHITAEQSQELVSRGFVSTQELQAAEVNH